MKSARSHYPAHLRETLTSPYRNILSAPIQPDAQPITFAYTIKANVRRQHTNPPIWHHLHYHQFEICLDLEATCHPGDLYGLDMVEVENQLHLWAEELPDVINEHPQCPYGTTEEMCLYFAKIPLDSAIQIIQVSVSETPNRVTSLKLN